MAIKVLTTRKFKKNTLGACRATSLVGAIVLRVGSTHCSVTSPPAPRRLTY